MERRLRQSDRPGWLKRRAALLLFALIPLPTWVLTTDNRSRDDNVYTYLAKEVTMIQGVHTRFYTSKPEELRGFFEIELYQPNYC